MDAGLSKDIERLRAARVGELATRYGEVFGEQRDRELADLRLKVRRDPGQHPMAAADPGNGTTV